MLGLAGLGRLHADEIDPSCSNAASRRRPSQPQRSLAALLVVAASSSLSACASAPLVQGLTLSSYDKLAPSDGMITKSRIHVNKEQVLAAKTLNIMPTTFSSAVAPKLTDQERALVANAVNRALCVSLSDRFELVTPDSPADLTVRAVVTQATETDEVAAGVSAAASVGMSFVDLGAPVPIPRIPIGLGNLSLEAEAIDTTGQQQAAMLWAKGATALFSSPKVSKASDAYDLAAAFGDDFAYLLVNGESPFGGMKLNIPSWQKINSAVGLAPKYAACESYGRSPGLVGLVGNKLALPPEWTDSGAKRAAE